MHENQSDLKQEVLDVLNVLYRMRESIDDAVTKQRDAEATLIRMGKELHALRVRLYNKAD